jgi:hypothetical protein
MFYVSSAAYDAAAHSIYTLTVPNNVAKRLVVSRFDRKDFTLSEEFVPTLADSAGLALGKERSLGEYMVSGAVVVDGMLYAMSAAHRTLLVINLATHRVVAAHVIADLPAPVGLAAKGMELYVLSVDGSVAVVPRPIVTPPVTAVTGKR